MQFSTLTEKINQESIGGACLTSISKKVVLSFDTFGFTSFKQFIVDNDKNIIDKMLLNLKSSIKKTQNSMSSCCLFPFENYFVG